MKRVALPILTIFLGVLTAGVWAAVIIERPKDYMEIAFLSVGQGDAILITSPVGNQVLVDGGPGRNVLRELGDVMPFYDRHIDVVIATHPDADHIGGLMDVLSRYEVGAFIDPGVKGDTALAHELTRLRDQKKIPYFVARKGMIIDIGQGAYIEIIFPDRDVEGLETNTASVIARAVYGEHEVLLTGDAPKSIEEYVVSLYGNRLQSDVLKVGHHGSNTSSALSFVSVVNPAIAVVSAGKDNRYGHPHQEVLDVFLQAGVVVFETAETGTIKVRTTGRDPVLVK